MKTDELTIRAMIDLINNEGDCVKGRFSKALDCNICPGHTFYAACAPIAAVRRAKEFLAQLTTGDIAEALL